LLIEVALFFQTLDSKLQCVGVYNNGTLLFGENGLENVGEGSKTWSYASYLEGTGVEYAHFICGSDLDSVCPDHLRGDWDYVNKKFQAFLRSLITAKVSLDDNCFFDLVPEKFLMDYCYVKDQICQYVFENYEKPDNYDHLVQSAALLHEIGSQKLNLRWSNVRNLMHKKDIRDQVNRLKKVNPYCRYNLFGTKTGRLTTRKSSFPILTMKKELRTIIEPTNDFFVSLDFNGAELRTLLALRGSEQPLEDIHEWNKVNVYRNIGTREEAKKRLFSWLYNPESVDYLSERFYNRDELVKKHWDGSVVKTPYGREIEVDKRRALNYLIQSTTSDMVLEQASKLRAMLAGKKTKIAFIIHDEVVLDVAKEEENMLISLKNKFQATRFGNFLVNSKMS